MASLKVTRILYKGLLRLAGRYDTYPLSKVYLEFDNGKKRFTPNISLKQEIRKNFRIAIQKEQPINIAFDYYKYLKNNIYKTEQSLPWYNQLTLESIQPATDVNTPKPIAVHDIKPGTVLISHPSVPGFYDKSVVLVVKKTDDIIYGVVIPGSKANAKEFWLGGNSTQEFWLLHTFYRNNAETVFPNLYFSPLSPNADIKSLSPSDYRAYCAITKWTPSTLSTELDTGSWFPIQCPAQLLFPLKTITTQNPDDSNVPQSTETSFDLTDDGSKNSDLWKRLLRSLGGEYSIFSYVDGMDLPSASAAFRGKSKTA